MFNLLMFNGVDWNSGTILVPRGRLFEYTEERFIAQFGGREHPALGGLFAYPCIFCEEGTGAEIARVGWINRGEVVGTNFSLEVSIDPDVPPFTNAFLYANRVALHMLENFEFSRNHWAIKGIDLYRFLLRSVRPRRQRPTVFQLPDHENVDAILASAMMPFDTTFHPVYDAIQRATEAVGMRCRRADDIWENASIIQDVVSLIDRSRIVICDCTGRNPNVFYEVGIAHTLGRDVILISQSEQDVPFDLRHLRHLRYENTPLGLVELQTGLQMRLQTIMGH